uniref:Non-structural maintenance of chromosomes element 1 homolog n=1 Tax=Panthera tigris altaica TaxID=74533 RepID=A0A8C9K8Q1_PANTA
MNWGLAGVMTDVHRRFLQLLMTHGVLEERGVRRLQKHCYRVHGRTAAVEELEDFINNINSVLESLYIEIKKGATEDDGRPVYALVNLATTPVSKMASDFAENELDLFRKALELIIDSETGFASSTNILNLVDQLKGKKMRKKEAEQVLQKFVQNKWLIEVRWEAGRANELRTRAPRRGGHRAADGGARAGVPVPWPRVPRCPAETEKVFNPDKEREAGTSKANKKPSRSRQH